MTRSYFPTRVYDDVVIPCGVYDAARVTLHFLHKAIEAVLETGEACQISTDGIRDAEALSFALPLLSAATSEELELAKDKVEFLISIS